MILNVTQQQYDEHVAHIRSLEQEYSDTLKRISDAKREGDLSENAQYEAGMRDKERIETALAAAKSELSKMKIVDTGLVRSIVTVPCTVVVQNLNSQQTMTLQIVASGGMPPDRVSAESKFGALVLGKRVGSIISYVDNAFREQRFKVLEIK